MDLTAHRAAIATLTDATTTAELATALLAITDLRNGAAPGTAPGVPDDAPDGNYQNGYHLFTKTGRDLAATAVNELPRETLDLWAQLDAELRGETRRGRGRPSIGRAVSVRLPDWRIAMLDRDAKSVDVERPELIRALILAGYASIRAAGSTGTRRVEAVRALLDGQAAAPTAAEQVLTTEASYHVEIRHPETAAWSQIHGLAWETTDNYPDAWIYATDVARDHPGSRVRVVEQYPGREATYLPLPEVM